MLIRMTVSIAGPGFALEPGDVTGRFSDAEAVRLIKAGSAVPEVAAEKETTVLSAPPERRGKSKRDVVPSRDD